MALNIEQQASRVMKKLRHQGCHVLGALKTPRGAIINIEHPTSSMVCEATEIRQKVKGIPSVVYTMTVDGCLVSWQQGGYLCQIH